MHQVLSLNSPNLQRFASNVHSQNGEDGILSQIFAVLGVEQGTFCEFGAWDGKHLSNTYALYEKGWRGWYIEGDTERHRDLLHNVTRADVTKICAFVAPDGVNTLDNLLSKDGTAPQIDLLSIDIDSDDLAVWRSVRTFRPTVVVIEYNPTIPIDVFYENPRGENRGNSARAILEHATSIDYALVAVTSCNLIFFDARLPQQPFSRVDILDPTLPLGERYFFGYDGTLFRKSVGLMSEVAAPEIFGVPWHADMFTQPLARPFRRYAATGLKPKVSFVVTFLRTFGAAPVESCRAFARLVRSRLG